MAYNIEKTKESLDSKLVGGPAKYCPLNAEIIQESGGLLYDVAFFGDDKVVRHKESGLVPQESFDLANEATLYLKTKGYACTIDLTDLPKDFKVNVLGIKN
jgi:hypothetical protein